MLEIWGETAVSGKAIDVLFDIESMRGELRTDDIRPLARKEAVARDIVLITIDTVRANRTPLHGGSARMPGLAQLGREGAVFEWAFASGNVTRRSLPTIATGISPRRLRGRIAGWAHRLDPRHVTLAERFRAAGYETAGFFCCYSQFGEDHQLGLNRGIDHLVIEGNGAELSKITSEWVKARDAKKSAKPLF
jgi:hypothetical protein